MAKIQVHRDWENEIKQYQQMKERLKKKYIRKLRMILKPDLHAKNKITEIGALAFPVLRHLSYY